MLIEIGHFSLVLFFVLSFFQALLPALGVRWNNLVLMKTGISLVVFCFFLNCIAFGSLISAHLRSDFSVLHVWENSHSLAPFLYKFTGTWASHEGSMLLWIFVISLWSLLFCFFSSFFSERFRAGVISVQGSITAAFSLFIILASNPFLRMEVPPLEGKDLNPLLQDIGLVIHPPLLYLGYAGFSVCFSCAIVSLIEGNISQKWAYFVRSWVLLAWMFLTAGITMGSWWAYYELGWGGFWFWDPVENLSFLPWLSATALLHSLAVMEKRFLFSSWVLLLSIMSFSLSLLGTFLIRSGMLSSIHSFTADPKRGLFIFFILIAISGGGFFLFWLRAPLIAKNRPIRPLSREGGIVFNNLFLLTALGIVLTGTLYPLFLEIFTGKKISVGPPFFNSTFIPFILPLLFFIPFGPLLSWKKANLHSFLFVLKVPFFVCLLCGLISFSYLAKANIFSAFFMGLAAWIISGSVADLFYRSRVHTSLKDSWSRFLGLPPWVVATAFAHSGVGVVLLGIIGGTLLDEKKIVFLKPGQTIAIGSHTIRFESMKEIIESNYVGYEGLFTVLETKKSIYASRRFYPARKTMTTEAGIGVDGLNQIYIVLADQNQNNEKGLVVQISWKPMIILIWGGGILIIIGGFYSLLSRLRMIKKGEGILNH